MRSLIPAAILTLLATTLAAQDLAAAAERERERRRKLGQKAQTYTDDDIPRQKPGAKASPSPPPEGSSSSVPRRLLGPGATGGSEEPSRPSEPQAGGCEGSDCGEAPDAGGGNAKTEEYWRQRTAALRQAVTDAEANVKRIETQIAGLRQGQSQPLPSDGLSQTPPNPLLAPPGAAALQQELEKAREELARAEQALQGLDEEGRKAGVPPGWIR